MKKLLNTLYVTSEDAYLSLNGENVEVKLNNDKKAFPIHTLESIVCFSYKGASPALMGKCAENNILLSFFNQSGKYLASVSNFVNGNVLLRREQLRIADKETNSLKIAKNMIIGKLYNSKYLLLKCARDHELQVDAKKIRNSASLIQNYMKDILDTNTKESLRGIEGNAAAEYFGCFDDMILQNKSDFYFCGRNKRPPTDNVNALLSLAYSLLANDYSHALQSVGLDPFVGFMHSDRPGRKSLALDMMEELRSVYADRFVLTLINNRKINSKHFNEQDNGAVLLTDEGRKIFLAEWQKKKKEEIVHPFLKEKINWGLVPFVQAMLLARMIRNDIDEYPPFLWK